MLWNWNGRIKADGTDTDEIAALKDELRQLLRKKAEAERLLAEQGESVVGKVEGTVKEAKKGWGLW